MEIDRVIAVNRQPQVAAVEADTRCERVAEVALADLPGGFVARPEQPAAPAAARYVGIDPEAARAAAGVVLLPDVGEVQVSDLVVPVEGHQQPAVHARRRRTTARPATAASTPADISSGTWSTKLSTVVIVTVPPPGRELTRMSFVNISERVGLTSSVALLWSTPPLAPSLTTLIVALSLTGAPGIRSEPSVVRTVSITVA